MSKLALKEIQNRLDILNEKWCIFDYGITDMDPELLSALEFAVDALDSVKHIAEKMPVFNNDAMSSTDFQNEVRDIIYDLTCTGPDYEE